MPSDDEPLQLSQLTYDNERGVVRFAFTGRQRKTGIALSGFTTVNFTGDPKPEATDRALREAVKKLLEEAASIT